MNDTISKQAAIDALCNNCDNMRSVCAYYPCKQYIAVAKLPFEQPERKRGGWIYEGERGRFPVCRCSVCGNRENADWAVLGDNVNYCPNCGAEMRKEEMRE